MSDVLSRRFNNFSTYTVVMLTAGLLMMGLLAVLGLMQINSRLILQKTNKVQELNRISALIGLTLNKVTLINRSAYRIMQEDLDKNTTPHALEKLLRNSSDGSFFHLDDLPKEVQSYNGNLTSMIPLERLSAQNRRILASCFALGSHYSANHPSLPNAPWFYFMSDQMMYLYPFVNSTDFHVTEDIKKKEFYWGALPDANPQRQEFWTKAYLDAAGAGMMITHSIPLWHNEEFYGSVNIDTTLQNLNAIISSSQPDFGRIFLINNHQQILAYPQKLKAEDQAIMMMTDILPPKLQSAQEQILNSSDDEMQKIGGMLVMRKAIPDSSFFLIFHTDKMSLYKAALQPVLWPMLLVLFATLATLTLSHIMIRKLFIRPSEILVEHLIEENGSDKVDMLHAPWTQWTQLITDNKNSLHLMMQQL